MSEPRTAPSDLDALERWMLEVVSNPDGVAEGIARAAPLEPGVRLEDIVLPSKQLSAEERLEVYANMYFWRLVDVLADDFPATRRLVGPDLFFDLAKAYLVAHPSRHYSLSMLGDRFPGFLETTDADVPHRSFAVDVARIERAVEEVFDVEAAPPLDPDDLLDVPPDSWNDVRLETTAAMRLLELRHPADDWLQAHREDRHEDVPAPRPAWLLVHRQDLAVWRVDLSREEFTTLECLARGATLGAALEACLELPDLDEDMVFRSVSGWFRRWAAKGLFTSISS